LSNIRNDYQEVWAAKKLLRDIGSLVDMCNDDSSIEELMLALSNIRIMIYDFEKAKLRVLR
jgi:hypothetical protein